MNVKEINDKYKEINGFDYNNDIVIDEVSKDKVVAHIDCTNKSYNPWSIVHGGLLFGLSDTAMGILCYMNNLEVVTTSANINYLKSAKKYVKVVATPIKIGKTLSICKADLYDENDVLIATSTMNYFSVKKS